MSNADQAAEQASDPARAARRCAILAGGSARRLGGAKAGALLAGKPLIAHPIRAAREAGLEPYVVAKPATDLPEIDCPVIEEPASPRHPLVGIVVALQLHVDPVVVIPCDTPLLSPSILAELATRPEPLVVIRSGSGLHPLIGLYTPELLQPLRDFIAGERPMREIVAELGAAELEPESLRQPGGEHLLHNVNTPEDLALAERLLKG